jgi:hypothetical protein
MAAVGQQSLLVGLQQNSSATKVVHISPSVSGASSHVEAGNVTVTTGVARNQLSPLLLPTLPRIIAAKGANDDEATLVGAAIFCQAEDFERGDLDMYIDGVSMICQAGTVGASSSDIGNPVENNLADEIGPTPYEICEISGMKLYPGEAVRDWKGRLVYPKYADPEPRRESLKHRSVEQQGAKFSESADRFISTSIAPEDL